MLERCAESRRYFNDKSGSPLLDGRGVHVCMVIWGEIIYDLLIAIGRVLLLSFLNCMTK